MFKLKCFIEEEKQSLNEFGLLFMVAVFCFELLGWMKVLLLS